MNMEPESLSPDTNPVNDTRQEFLWTCIRGMAVVLIVVLGLSLVWAGLNKSREQARRATCFNNLFAMGLSFRLYSGDNKERFPCDANWTTLGSLALLTNNYQTSYKTWLCPSDDGISQGYPSRSWTAANLSYAYNGFGLTEKSQPDTPFLADRTSNDIRNNTPWASNVWTHKTNGGNVLYVDGHVEFRTILPVPMYNGKNP